jgi:soluble lytic murein transglycosylase-like protein
MGYLFMAIAALLLLVKFGMSKEKDETTYIDYTEGETTIEYIPDTNDALENLIQLNSKKYVVPVALIKAIIKTESSWKVYAINPSDPSYGLMQIQPSVAQDYGIVKDYKNPTAAEINAIYIPANNVGAGCKLLGHLLSKYDRATSVQMYNVGETGYKKGYRNLSYLNKVIDAFKSYGGV